MNVFTETGRKLSKINVNRILSKTLKDNSRFLADQNISSWDEGQYPGGGFIEPPYTPFTVRKKIEKGQESDFVTLQDTGDFAKGVKAIVGGDFVEMDSTDSKSGDLKDKYGEEIFGIDDFTIRQIQDILINNVKELI